MLIGRSTDVLPESLRMLRGNLAYKTSKPGLEVGRLLYFMRYS